MSESAEERDAYRDEKEAQVEQLLYEVSTAKSRVMGAFTKVNY